MCQKNIIPQSLNSSSAIHTPLKSNFIPASPLSPNISHNSSAPLPHFALGDRVKCSNSMVGLCRFIGTIDNKPGLWVGIDLGANVDDLVPDRWYAKGKNSGSVNGVSYFDCDPDCGIFFPIAKVAAFPYPPASPSLPLLPPDSPSKPIPLASPPARQRRLSKPSLAQPGPTPRPKSRPSLPAQTRKPTLPGSASTNTLARPPLARKMSTNLSLDRDRGSAASKLVSPPPLPNSTVRPLSSSLATSFKRSSASQLPPTRPHSRGSHKRAESVQSHYQAPSSDWPRFQQSHRPKSRLSQISSDSRPPKDEPAAPTDIHTGELEMLAMQVRIEELEKAALERSAVDAELERARAQVHQLEEDLAGLKAQAELASQLADQASQSRLLDAEREQAEHVTRLADLERERELYAARLADAERQREEMASAHAARLAAAEREQAELQEQLGQLRTAGQSLCSVYEDKMAGLAELREMELEEASRLREELHGAREQLAAMEARLATGGPGPPPSRSHEAVEIDNERLRADLKYTKERLGEVQDTAYELRQELATEREAREQLGQQHDEARAEHKLVVKRLKDEMAGQSEEREALQERLSQVEARFKETLETMEQERAELEGLRDEVLVSGHQDGRARPTPSLLAAGHDERDASRLRVELGRRESGGGGSDGPSTSVEQEKQQIVQKYQRLLSIKDEENLSLVNRVADLEDELANLRKADRSMITHSASLTSLRKAGGLEDINNGVGDILLHQVGTGTGGGARVEKEYMDEKLKTANEQIVGLKLIVSQAHVDRAKVEEENSGLKSLVEELKEANEELERKLEGLTPAHKSSPSGSGFGKGVSLAGQLTSEHVPTWNGSTTTGFVEQEEALNEVRPAPSGEPSEVRKVRRLEREVEALRVKVAGMERLHTREVRGLHKEVAELESMIESKVFKEEELEQEIEQLRKRNGTGRRKRRPSGTDVDEETCEQQMEVLSDDADLEENDSCQRRAAEKERCELCEEAGHGLEACPVFLSGMC